MTQTTNRLTVATMGLLLFDALITTAFWELESNPVIISLGVEYHLLLKVFLAGAIGVVVYYSRNEWPRITLAGVAGWFVLYFVVAITNIVAVMVFLT